MACEVAALPFQANANYGTFIPLKNKCIQIFLIYERAILKKWKEALLKSNGKKSENGNRRKPGLSHFEKY